MNCLKQARCQCLFVGGSSRVHYLCRRKACTGLARQQLGTALHLVPDELQVQTPGSQLQCGAVVCSFPHSASKPCQATPKPGSACLKHATLPGTDSSLWAPAHSDACGCRLQASTQRSSASTGLQATARSGSTSHWATGAGWQACPARAKATGHSQGALACWARQSLWSCTCLLVDEPTSHHTHSQVHPPVQLASGKQQRHGRILWHRSPGACPRADSASCAGCYVQ